MREYSLEVVSQIEDDIFNMATVVLNGLNEVFRGTPEYEKFKGFSFDTRKRKVFVIYDGNLEKDIADKGLVCNTDFVISYREL